MIHEVYRIRVIRVEWISIDMIRAIRQLDGPAFEEV